MKSCLSCRHLSKVVAGVGHGVVMEAICKMRNKINESYQGLDEECGEVMPDRCYYSENPSEYDIEKFKELAKGCMDYSSEKGGRGNVDCRQKA